MSDAPRFARWLLARLAPATDRPTFLGDVDEAFQQRASTLGDVDARRWYWRQVITSAAPLIRHRVSTPAPSVKPATGDPMWRELLDDLRFAVRLTNRNRVAMAAVVGTMVLGIGVTTAVFSIVNSVLLRPLPFDGSERVVQLGMTLRSGQYTPRMAYPDMQDYARDAASFEGFSTASLDGLTLTQGDIPRQMLIARVSDGYTRLFGIRPVLGRFFAADEFRPNARVVMISDGVWRQDFGADPAIVGKAISLGNEPYTVVGVLPPLSYTYPFAGVELLAPLSPAPGTYQANRGALWLSAVGKMKQGVPLERGRREIATIADRLAREYPDANGGLGIRITPLHEVEVGDVRPMLVLLSAAVIAVLLIACVNIANVLVGISHARARELAVRVALGGSAGRIRRQLLTESLILAIGGGALGTMLAPLVLRGLIALYPGALPRATEVGIDLRVLLVAAAVTIVAGLVAGLPAARRSMQLNLSRDLREGSRGSGTVAQRRFGRLLVMSQVAMSIALLFSAGLLLRTFRSLSNTDPGFSARDLTTFQISAARARYAGREQVAAYYAAVDRELRAIPGVGDVTMAGEVPLSSNGSLDIFVPKERGDRGKENPQVRYAAVSPGYWKTLGVPLLAGRTFTEDDGAAAPRVVVVNDVLAKRVYPGEDPVGRVIVWGNLDWQIIGVVGSIRMRTLSDSPEPELYSSTTQDMLRSRYVFVKSPVPSTQLVPQLRQALRRVDASVAMTEVASIDVRFVEALAPQRFRASLIGGLGMLALALSTLGIYGVIAYAVSRQTREIGVRMALGEEQAQVRRRIVLSAMRMTGAGVAVGAVLALGASRWLAAFLVGVDPRDPLMLGASAAVLLAVAAVGAYIPARRASRIDPLIALRSE